MSENITDRAPETDTNDASFSSLVEETEEDLGHVDMSQPDFYKKLIRLNCASCGKVIPTARGMIAHLANAHNVKINRKAKATAGAVTRAFVDENLPEQFRNALAKITKGPIKTKSVVDNTWRRSQVNILQHSL
jgi:hypothetical protein